MTLSPQTQAILDRLLRTQPMPPARMEELIRAHLERAHHSTSPFVDIVRARQVADRCRQLLVGFEGLSAEEQRLVQAAVLYFAEPSDEENDFESIVGFDDDAEVVNHVARALRREDLVIELGR